MLLLTMKPLHPNRNQLNSHHWRKVMLQAFSFRLLASQTVRNSYQWIRSFRRRKLFPPCFLRCCALGREFGWLQLAHPTPSGVASHPKKAYVVIRVQYRLNKSLYFGTQKLLWNTLEGIDMFCIKICHDFSETHIPMIPCLWVAIQRPP